MAAPVPVTLPIGWTRSTEDPATWPPKGVHVIGFVPMTVQDAEGRWDDHPTRGHLRMLVVQEWKGRLEWHTASKNGWDAGCIPFAWHPYPDLPEGREMAFGYEIRPVEYEECEVCDGVGWHEGGKSLQTKCGTCEGYGVLKVDPVRKTVHTALNAIFAGGTDHVHGDPQVAAQDVYGRAPELADVRWEKVVAYVVSWQERLRSSRRGRSPDVTR
jgi:hypothetical protein